MRILFPQIERKRLALEGAKTILKGREDNPKGARRQSQRDQPFGFIKKSFTQD